MQWELLAITIPRALVEVAGFALLGQGLVALLAGRRREDNFVYRLFREVTRPVTRLVRAILPRFIIDAHVPFITFFLLLWLWLVLAWVKRAYCLSHHLVC